MEKKLNLCVNFGFASSQGSEVPSEAYEKIAALMREFLNSAQKYNCEKYGFTGQEIPCNIFSGDLFCTEGIYTLAKENSYKLNIVTSAHTMDSEKINADSVIALNVKKHNLSYPNITAEYVVNKSDAIFLLWDGKQSFQEGILWTILQFCKQHNTPYYLINTAQPENISFSSDSYYVPYSSQKVQDYIAALYDHKETTSDNTRIPFSNLWLKLHNHFMNKYKLKVENVPYVEDKILSADSYSGSHRNHENHSMLTEYFNYYDQKAIEASTMYRASIYFRSILPLLTTIFITIGFYAETVLGFLLGKPTLLGMNFWVIFAGIGFLIHALLNVYAGQISKNKRVKQFRKDFIEARFIAEHLRIAIHSETYGIPLDNIRQTNSHIETHVYAKLHHILRQQNAMSYVQTKEEMNEAFANFEALIADQLAYHENTIRRYELITKRLSKLAAALSGISVAIVILRGILQFIIPYAAIGMNLSLELNGIKLESFIKSFANMLALVMPAWASYISAKLNMNSYAWLRNNSMKMKDGFLAIQTKLKGTDVNSNPSYQIINDLASDILQLTQEDYTGWYLHTDSQGFTRL